MDNYGLSFQKISRACTKGFLAVLFFPLACAAADETKSVVTIYAELTNGGSSQGTGFFISKDGRIATAYHVIQDAKRIEIYDHTLKRFEKIVVEWLDADHDLAVIRVGASTESLSISTAPPVPRSEIRIAGSPRGLPKQVLHGRVTSEGFVQSLSISSAAGRAVFSRQIDVLPLDVTIYGGMSGAPVMSPDGVVLGVLSGSYDEGRGIGWAIPAKYLLQLSNSKPMNVGLEQVSAWPQLTLMRPGWVSLKRSYGVTLSASHIAQLEILEGAYPRLRGDWIGSSENRKLHYDQPNGLGRCETLERLQVELTVAGVDQSTPMVLSKIKQTFHREAIFTDRPQSFDTPELRAQRIGFCNERSFKDKLTTLSTITASGTLRLRANARYASANVRFPTTIDVTDCQGNSCNASLFGKGKTGDLEIISDNKVRWSDTILQKQ